MGLKPVDVSLPPTYIHDDQMIREKSRKQKEIDPILVIQNQEPKQLSTPTPEKKEGAILDDFNQEDQDEGDEIWSTVSLSSSPQISVSESRKGKFYPKV